MLGVFLSIFVYMKDKDAVDTPTIILCGIALALYMSRLVRLDIRWRLLGR